MKRGNGNSRNTCGSGRGGSQTVPTASSQTSAAWAARLSEPRIVCVLLGIVALGFCGLFFNPMLSTIGDNAQYVVLAKSLLAGKGLSHINAPDHKPDTKYPFMYPLILAGVILVAPGSIVALKLVGIAACVGAAVLYYPMFRRSSAPIVAAGAALLAVLSPDVLRHSTVILAEVPYLLASMAALAWVSAKSDRLPERKWVPVALALVMVAYYMKAVGIALAVGIVFALLIRRRVAWALSFLGGFVLLALPWAVRSQRIQGAGSYIDYLFMKDPYRPHLGVISGRDLLSRITGNVEIYFDQIVPESVLPFLGQEGLVTGPRLQVVFWVASILVGVGLAYRLWRHRAVPDFYLLGFLGICALWPRVWASVRFIVPVVPLLILCLLTGLWVVFGAAARIAGERVRSACVAGLVGALAVGFVGVDRVEARWEREYSQDWASYFQAARWVKANTAPESIVIARKPYLFFLVSDRRSVGYHFSEDPNRVLRGIREAGATHIVIDQFLWTGTTGTYLVPAIRAHPERFEVVFATERMPGAFVVRILGAEMEEES